METKERRAAVNIHSRIRKRHRPGSLPQSHIPCGEATENVSANAACSKHKYPVRLSGTSRHSCNPNRRSLTIRASRGRTRQRSSGKHLRASEFRSDLVNGPPALISLLLVAILSTTNRVGAMTSYPGNRLATARHLQRDPFAQAVGYDQDEHDSSWTIHCSPPGARRFAIDTADDPDHEVGIGPVLQECHPVVAASDPTKTLGSVCVDVVPKEDTSLVPTDTANTTATSSPSVALRFSFLGLQDTRHDYGVTAASTTAFLKHSVWVGDSAHSVPRKEETGDIDYDQFPAQWHNTTEGGARKWQSQLPLECHDKKHHTFYVVTGSLASTTTTASDGSGTSVEEEFAYAMEFDGQGGGSWYGWMEIQVDCQCSTKIVQEDSLPPVQELQPQDHTPAAPTLSDASLTKDRQQGFFPYDNESCQGPDLFRLRNDPSLVDTASSSSSSQTATSGSSDVYPEDEEVCWDLVDSVLHTPLSRLCIEITSQDSSETEITVTFSSLGYSKLTQTSFWAGIHPDQHRIQDVPTHKDKGGQLKLEAWDQFFWDPNGLPDIVFEFHLPTDVCAHAMQPSTALDASSNGLQEAEEDSQNARQYNHMAMSSDGIIGIPMVAFAESKAQSPEGMFLSNSAGYVYEYRHVNDQTEFGWMELQLQCGCSRSEEHKVLRRQDIHTKSVGSMPSRPKETKVPKTTTCRTAFAHATSKPEMIHPLSDMGHDAWGYTNGPFASSYSYITMDLYEKVEPVNDRGDDEQERKVGTLKVFFDGDKADVTFNMDETFPLYETQLYVGTEPLPVLRQKASVVGAATAIGMFTMPNQHDRDDMDSPYSDSYSVLDFDYGDTIYVMAYAADCAEVEEPDDLVNSTSGSHFPVEDAAGNHACLRAESDCFSLTSRSESGPPQGISAGQVCFALDASQDYLDVRYSLPERWALIESEVWIGEIIKDLPTTVDKSPDFPNFGHTANFHELSQSWTTRIPIFRKEQCGVSKTGSFDFVAVAHALVGKSCTNSADCVSPILAGSEQHAYAEETLIQRNGKWFFFVDMSVDCQCSDASGYKVLPAIPPTMPPTSSPTDFPTLTQVTPTQLPSTILPTGSPSPPPTQGPKQKEIDMSNTCIYTDDDSGEYCLSLYAAQAWEPNAGSVCLVMVDGQLAIIYDVVNYWALVEANIWVGSNILDVPTAEDGNPDVRAFPFSRAWLQGTDSFTEVIPMASEIREKCQTTGAFDVAVMAHGLVAEPSISPTKDQPFVPFSQEDAFAKAIDFSDAASYILASVVCDCNAFYGHQRSRSLSEIAARRLQSTPMPPSTAPGFVSTPSVSPVLDSAESDNHFSLRENQASSSTPGVVGSVCESAWAVDANMETICHPSSMNETKSCGWSNGPFLVADRLVIFDLFIATNDCSMNGTNMGTVWFSWNQETSQVDVDFLLDSDAYYLADTHIYLGTHQLLQDEDLNPSRFPLTHSHLSTGTTEDTFNVPVALEAAGTDLQYFSAHATLCTLPKATASGPAITDLPASGDASTKRSSYQIS